MADVFDSLDALGSMQGEDAPKEFESAPLPYETPNAAASRVASQTTQRMQYGRMKAQDLSERGVPYTMTPRGNVQEITDESGAPLSNADKANKVAYDSTGRAVDYSQRDPTTGKPVVQGAYDNVPDWTDPKSGEMYRKRQGLPWLWTGTNNDVQQQVQQQQAVKLNQQTNTALAPLQTEAKTQFVADSKAVKDSLKQTRTALQAQGLSVDPSGDPDVVRKQIEDAYNTEYGSDRANAAPWFGGGKLSPDAESYRKDIDARKAAAMEVLTSHLGVVQQANQSKAQLQQIMDQRADLGESRLDEINKKRVAAGLQPVGIQQQPAANTTTNLSGIPDLGKNTQQYQDDIASGKIQVPKTVAQAAQQAPGAEGTTGDQGQSASDAQAKRVVQSNLDAATAGQKLYGYDPKTHAVQFNAEKPYDSLKAAARDGVIDMQWAKDQESKFKLAQASYEDLVQSAGGASEAKALAHGAGLGAAFMLGARPGAAAGALIPGLGETGIGEVLGGLTTGSIAAWGASKGLDKLGEYSDAMKSLNASAQLHPNYNEAGQLVAFGTQAPEAISNLVKLGKIAGGGAEAAKAIGLKVAAGGAGGLAFEAGPRVLFDAAVNTAQNALGLPADEVQAPTVKSLVTNAALGVLLAGHDLRFKDYTVNDATSILYRDKVREMAGVAPDAEMTPQDVVDTMKKAGIDIDPQKAQDLTRPLTPAEQHFGEATKAKLQEMKDAGVPGVQFEGGQQATNAKGKPLASKVDVSATGESGASPTDQSGTPSPSGPAGLGGAIPRLPGPAHEPSTPSQPSSETSSVAAPPQPVSGSPAPTGAPQAEAVAPAQEIVQRTQELAQMAPNDPMRPLLQGRINQLSQQVAPPSPPASAPSESQPVVAQPSQSEQPIAPASPQEIAPQVDAHENTGAEGTTGPAGELAPPASAPVAPVPAEPATSSIAPATQERPPQETTPAKPLSAEEQKSAASPEVATPAPPEQASVASPKQKPPSQEKAAQVAAPAQAGGGTPQKPTAVLHEASRVKLTAPQGARFLRVTDNKGRQIVEPIENVTKGANVFHGAGPFKKVEAGMKNSKKEFVPLKGEISAVDANKPVEPASAPEKQPVASEPPNSKSAQPPKSTTLDKEADSESPKGAQEAVSSEKAITPAKASPEAQHVNKLANAALALHAPELAALGHPHEFVTGSTRAGSGIETDVQTQRIHLDPEKMAKATAGMTPAKRAEFVKRVVAEEVIHVGTLKYAEEKPENREKLMALTDDKDLMKRAAEAYGPEWDKQSDLGKAAEAARMLIQGPEKLTEASYKFLKDFLDWLKDKLKNLSKDAREVVDGIRQKLGTYEKESEGTKEQAPPEKRGSTQVTLSDKDAKPLRDFVNSIPEGELYHGEKGSDSYGPEYGRELESHVTALYGLTGGGDKAKAVAAAVKQFGPVTVKLGKISAFKNEGSPYDVLKVDVDSPDLHRLNAALKKLPFKSDFPDYHPHLTLAYVKKGEADKYVGDDRFDGKEITIDSLTHSSAEREKTQIPLTKTDEKSAPAPLKDSPEVDKLRDRISEIQAEVDFQKEEGDPEHMVEGLQRVMGKLQENLKALRESEKPAAEQAKPNATEQIKSITANADAKKAAERLEKAPDTSPAKLKVQKAYLLDALDKAIETTPTDHAPAFATDDGKQDSKALADFNRYDSAIQKEKPHAGYAYGKTDAEKLQEKEQLKAWEEKASQQLKPLFDKYNIPEKEFDYPGYRNSEGGTQDAREGGPLSLDARTALLADAIHARDYESQPKIEIEVPGDGTFKIINTKDALKEFRKTVEKEFPTKTLGPQRMPGSANMRTDETKIPSVSKPKGPGEIVRIAGTAASIDPTRSVIMSVYSDGKKVVASDGRRAVVIDARAGGTEEKPVFFDSKTAKPKKLDGNYPQWKIIIPDPAKQAKVADVDTGTLTKLLIQAREMTSERSNSVKLFANPDGSIGVTSEDPATGEFSGNVQPKAKLIAAYNPDFLIDGLKMARAMGHEMVQWNGDKKEPSQGPATFDAKGFKYVLMPMRISGADPSLAGADPATNKVYDAYKKVTDRVGFPAVPISELQKEAGVPMDKLKDWLTKLHNAGDVVLSRGDWSIASPEERKGAIQMHGRDLLQARFTGAPSIPFGDKLAAANPDGTPTPEEGKAPEGQEPSGSQPNPLLPEGTLATNETTQAQRNEKLMEEAEAAGLAPSLETIKGVLRNDPTTMDKLRQMIKDKTGKDAINAATPSEQPLGAANPNTPAGKYKVPGLDIGRNIKEGIQSLVLPSAIDKEHLEAAETLGAKLGSMNQRAEAARAQTDTTWMKFERKGVHMDQPLAKNEGVQFMSNASTGKPQSPEFKPYETIRNKQYEKRVDLLEKADAPLQTVRENYFPGVWTNESRAAFNLAMKVASESGIIPEGQSVNDATPTQKAWVKKHVDEYLKEGKGSDQSALGYLTKSPFKGKEGFRKQKVFDQDIATAFEFGLRPVSYNPVDIDRLKWAEMDRNIMANQALQQWKAEGKMKVIGPTQKVPDGWAPVDDKYGTVYGPREITVTARNSKLFDSETGEFMTPQEAGVSKVPPDGTMLKVKVPGIMIVGKRIVPQPVADVLNNYLSSSLYNNKYFGTLYKGWMGTANALNQSQLGVGSAFHAGFTTAEAEVSAGAELIKDIYGLARGNRHFGHVMASVRGIANAGLDTAKLISYAGREGATGDKVLNAWRFPDKTIDPKVAQIVRAAELAGGGFTMERGLQTDQTSKMVSDWFNGHKVRAAFRSPVSAIELLAHPIMNYLVPRQKAGVFAHLAGRIIDQNPGVPLEDLTAQFRQAWNRIDARMGQVRYDRLFANNVAKNVVQGLVRAPGWTGGTLAELGGAFKDTYGFFHEWATTGKAPQNIPDRTAYTISLVLGTMLVNGILTKLMTGEDPHGLDYLAFRDGGKDEKGNQSRLVLPTYMKDLLAYSKEPLGTLADKAHPLLALIHDLVKNKDYYGVKIRNEDDSKLKQAYDSGKYFVKAFEPFWIKGQQKQAEQGKTAAQQALPLIGVMPASHKLTDSPAQRLASEYARESIPIGGRTQQQADSSLAKSKIVQQLRAHEMPDIPGAVRSGLVKPTDIDGLFKQSTQTPLQATVLHLPLDKAEAVFKVASPDEQRQLLPIMGEKRFPKKGFVKSPSPYEFK